MKLIHYLMGTAVLWACTYAYATGSGEFTRKGQTTKLPNAYALRQADHFDDKKILTTVLFSTMPLDTAKVDAASDRMKEAESQLGQLDAFYAELDIGADGKLEMIGFFGPGLSVSGGASEQPVLVQNDEKRIEGTFRSKDEKEKAGSSGGFYDLKFALDIAPAKH